MVNQYPYVLKVASQEEATKDSSGNWVPGASSLNVFCICRTEPNGSGRMITLSDGSSYQHEFVVYMPLGNALEEGKYIEVYDGDRLVAKGLIKRFYKGQLNMMLWL